MSALTKFSVTTSDSAGRATTAAGNGRAPAALSADHAGAARPAATTHKTAQGNRE